MTFIEPSAAPENVRDNVRSFSGVSMPAGEHAVLRECFGWSTELRDGPQGFLVDFPAESRTGAHFHPVDQFQVFFPSDGAVYQRTPLDMVLLHYTDAFTTYGPFSSGPERLRFYTLRAQPSTTTAFMPKDRDQLVRVGRRHFEVGLDEARVAPVDRGHSERVELIPSDDDGLAAWLVVAGPDTPFSTDPAGGAGQYHVVVRGALADADGRRVSERSIAWGPAGSTTAVTASDAGCCMLVMQFPLARP